MIQDVEPFHAISISRRAHELAASGRSILHLEFGQPSTGAPGPAIARAHAVLDADPMGYWESPLLRERIARHYLESYGVRAHPDQIILTCGASPALVLALASSLRPGARVAMARPGYVAYRNVVRALHMVPVEIPCGPETGYLLEASAILSLTPPPDALIIASPANPTGTVTPPEVLAGLAEACAGLGTRIISDEIYHGLSYVGPARSMLEFTSKALVINSFSKYFSMPGWRLGWLAAPEDLLAAARARAGNLFLTPPSLSQHAGLAAFEARDELEGHLETYRANRALLLGALEDLGLKKIAPPDGAFYVYADVAHLTSDSLAFCREILEETGVALAPGLDFDPVDGGRFVRFSFAVSTARVAEALERLKPWFRARAACRGSS